MCHIVPSGIVLQCSEVYCSAYTRVWCSAVIFPQHYVTICARSLFTSNYTTSMHNTSLNYCIALHYTALHCNALYCIALQCTAMPCTTLHCIALNCIAPMRGSSSTRLTADGNNYRFAPGILDSRGDSSRICGDFCRGESWEDFCQCLKKCGV